MRYLGNKSKLLTFIDETIKKYDIKGETFADLFSGTGSVGDYFKGKYRIIANDYMEFAAIFARAKIFNARQPDFAKFKKHFNIDPFTWLNDRKYTANDNYFVYQNYSPAGNRKYFTESNALKIDGMRLDIEELFLKGILEWWEYNFLLASLIESSMSVSNTSGTYQAFFKFWESRALRQLKIEPLEIQNACLRGINEVYSEDISSIVRKISGDIAYLDPPYTITQYTNSYHVLETIAKYDSPEIFGKTGRRKERVLSGFSNKNLARYEFEDLFRQIDFEHVLLSYSNQSLISLDEIIELASRFAVNGEVHIEEYGYREYATNNLSYKGSSDGLKEALIYFRKDRTINKSPLNYSGSKDTIMPLITKLLPKHVECFVDAMGGAFNVGANVASLKKTVYVEYNKYVYEIIEMLIRKDKREIISQVENIVADFNMRKENRDAYISLRESYNKNKTPIKLFVLQMYSFQNIIRFNSHHDMNTPVGNNEYCASIAQRIENFRIKSPECEVYNMDYRKLDLTTFPADTIFYFDPPYFITTAEYNDGKRGLEGWDVYKEIDLLRFLEDLNKIGRKFILSNTLVHKGKRHQILIDWIAKNNFQVRSLGRTGIKYPREEVIVTNYTSLF